MKIGGTHMTNIENYLEEYKKTVFVHKFIQNDLSTGKTAKDLEISQRTIQKWLKEPDIIQLIESTLKNKTAALNVTTDYVLQNLHHITEDSMGRIQHVYTPTPTEENPDPTPIVSTHEDYDTAIKALTLLGKYNKMFTERSENINVTTNFEEYIKKVESEDEY
jgi:hypothetical protein